MKLLFDTHVFLWFISGDPRLPGDWQQMIRAPDNEVFLSVVSVWEAAVKHQIGKLPLPEPAGTYLPTQRARHSITSLPLDERSVARLAALPFHHRNPFDRMLVCQALEHGLTILTVDPLVSRYLIAD